MSYFEVIESSSSVQSVLDIQQSPNSNLTHFSNNLTLLNPFPEIVEAAVYKTTTKVIFSLSLASTLLKRSHVLYVTVLETASGSTTFKFVILQLIQRDHKLIFRNLLCSLIQTLSVCYPGPSSEGYFTVGIPHADILRRLYTFLV